MEIRSTDSLCVTSSSGALSRTVKLIVGAWYIVRPLNSHQGIKNQGRVVELLGLTDSFMPRGAIIRYLDNNRRGRIDTSDLVPYGDIIEVKPRLLSQEELDYFAVLFDAKKRKDIITKLSIEDLKQCIKKINGHISHLYNQADKDFKTFIIDVDSTLIMNCLLVT